MSKEVKVLCLGGKFSQRYYNKHPELLVKENSETAAKTDKKEGKSNLLSYIIYFALVFGSNIAIVIMTRFIDTNKVVAFMGNAGYEACNITSLYIGIKNLPLKQMLFWHLISASAGYIVAQLIGNMI